MSSKPQFLAIVHDFPGMIQKRIEVRQAHLSVVGQNQAIRAGGFSPQYYNSQANLYRCNILQRTHTRRSHAICRKPKNEWGTC
jgi:hypothetical protein